MTPIPEKRTPAPGPSMVLCRTCGSIEHIRANWQRCWMCHIRSETRHTRTYPAFCGACCLKLHS